MTSKIKVLHIVSGDLSGGAAKGAYWLHKGLIEIGVNSNILTNSTNTYNDKTVHSISKSNLGKLLRVVNSKLDQLPLRLYPKRQNIIFSLGARGYDITKNEHFKSADIIHLHWINDGFINIKHLQKIRKPIVWTLRDMWPITGGCHYSMDCQNYKTNCGNCPILGSNSNFDVSRYVFNRKLRYYPENISVVGISNWISSLVKENGLLSKCDIKTIYNNIDCDVFTPVDKSIARNILGIKTEKKIILAGARSIKDYYKGFQQYIDSLKHLESDEYYLIFFGVLDEGNPTINQFEHKNMGYLSDSLSLRLVYSAADVFVAPSLMEAFGKTIVEAMACGTPAVCYNATGPVDIVDHKTNGYLAHPFDPYDLSLGVKWIVNNNDYNNLAREARSKAINSFNVELIAKEYFCLYNSLLNNN